MSQKIFISYRRQDSAANALGIGQYMEHEFGRKNVFIDIDMRAGTNFPTVLEQRLAECKVMLVLIGPNWVNALDEQGRRRLDDADDWVRLEIAHALKRNITVIPVRVNGAELPLKATLPDDIRGLLDHQAASVTIAGFRNEMSGLVRDIRSIRSPWPWRRYGSIAAGLLLLLTVLAFAQQTIGFRKAFEQIRLLAFSQISGTATHNDIWKSSPGEWVAFAIDRQPKPNVYYFKPSSVKAYRDRVVYTARFPLKLNTASPSRNTLPQAAYEDDRTVLDCKKSTSTMTERTTYNKSGEVIFHFNRGDPESLDLSTSEPTKAGSILSIAEHLMCDEQLRTPLLSEQQLTSMKLSYLGLNPNGDGDIFYGPTKTTSDSAYQVEVLFVVRSFEDHKFSELFPEQAVLGFQPSFHTLAQVLQFNCTDRKVQIPKTEYFDPVNHLIYLFAPIPLQPANVTEGSPADSLLNVACGANVGGTYEGMNNVSYKSVGQGEQKISIYIEQIGSDLNVSFQSVLGGQGKGTGKLTGSQVKSISLQSTAPECPGSYEASFEFAGDSVSWSYKGKDCGGPMEGHGTAKRVKS